MQTCRRLWGDFNYFFKPLSRCKTATRKWQFGPAIPHSRWRHQKARLRRHHRRSRYYRQREPVQHCTGLSERRLGCLYESMHRIKLLQYYYARFAHNTTPVVLERPWFSFIHCFLKFVKTRIRCFLSFNITWSLGQLRCTVCRPDRPTGGRLTRGPNRFHRSWPKQLWWSCMRTLTNQH